METNFEVVAKQAKAKKQSVLSYVKSLVKDSYDAIVTNRNINRFKDEVGEVVRRKTAKIEDLEDAKLSYMKQADLSSEESREEAMLAVISKDNEISTLIEEIAALDKFKVGYLD
jgi:hypothetical protein